MNQERDTQARRRTGLGGLSYRTISGIILAVLVVIFIAMNRNDTKVSFIVFSAEASLWVALAVAAAGGFVAGFLVSRRRYRGG